MKHLIATAANTHHWNVDIPQTTYFTTVTMVLPTFSCTKLLYITPYHLFFLLLPVQTYHPYFLNRPRVRYATGGCMGVENRVTKGLNVQSRTLVVWTTDNPSLSSKGVRPSRPFGARVNTLAKPLITAKAASRTWASSRLGTHYSHNTLLCCPRHNGTVYHQT